MPRSIGIFNDAMDVMDFDPDEGYVTFNLDGWHLGTLDEFIARKALFEKAVAAMKSIDGSITVTWTSDHGGSIEENRLVSEDGFMLLSFKTGPNSWGDFEAKAYSL